MSLKSTKIVLLCGCLLLVAQMASAQRGAPPPPPPPPAQHGGAPGGMPGGGPPNAGAPAPRPQATRNTSKGAQLGPPGRWWDDTNVRKSVGLSAVQQKKMDSIFDANKSAIVSSYQTLTVQQTKLDAMNKQSNVDSKALMNQIDAVNSARSSLQKATSQMLLELRGQMDSSQIEKLQKLQ